MFNLATLLTAIALVQAQPADPPSLAPGTIAVEQGAKRDPGRQAFAEAVGGALNDAGFLTLPDAGHAHYVATIKVTRIGRGVALYKVRAAAADAFQGTQSAAVGVGMRVTLPTGKSRLGQLVSTELEVRIRRRGESQTIWVGRATTAQVDGTRRGEQPAVAVRLADALFRNFPGRSGLTISVP